MIFLHATVLTLIDNNLRKIVVIKRKSWGFKFLTEISKSKTCKVKQIELNLKPGFYAAVNGYYLDDTTKRVITVLLYKFCMIKHIFQKVILCTL